MANGQQTVLITGGTDGLGKAAALLLAEKGYRVFASGRSAEKRAELDRLAAAKKLPPGKPNCQNFRVGSGDRR